MGTCVAPLVGAWIEMHIQGARRFFAPVAPLVGAWIEISKRQTMRLIRSSLPSWERGLKWPTGKTLYKSIRVAPLVGAWIEILLDIIPIIVIIVAPLVGAWIEIPFADTIEKFSKLSLPSWERGLK